VVDEGRCIFVFEKAEGSNNVWRELDGTQKVCSFPNASIPPVTYFLLSTISYFDVLTFEQHSSNSTCPSISQLPGCRLTSLIQWRSAVQFLLPVPSRALC
jgi:hypothetical protein